MSTYSRIALSNIINSIERSKTERSIEDLFVEQLDMSVKETQKLESHLPSKTYKPSGMNCMRACFYSILGAPIVPEIKNLSALGICESGTDRHIRIQQAIDGMRNNGFDLDYIDVETYINSHNLSEKLQVVSKDGMETKIYCPELNMSFLTDGIIKFNSIYYIFEFKTEIPNKFYKRTGIDPTHITQGTAYSSVFNIPQVLFLYENRATCEHKAFLLDVTDDMKNERIYNFIDSCNEYINNMTVPPLPMDSEVIKKCKYCQYKALCASHG